MTDARWTARQQWMERDYLALLDQGDALPEGFENDFRDIADLLQRCRGRVLDVGGGCGIARHWLPRGVEYVLVEPSPIWRDERWLRLAHRFASLAQPCRSVRAFAEALPFPDACFDATLCLWTLNHVARVEDALSEMVRVLRPGGRLLVVLEESEPSWHDLRTGGYPDRDGMPRRAAAAAAKLLRPLVGRRLQPDHVEVPERALFNVPGAHVIFRAWRGLYLTFELERGGLCQSLVPGPWVPQSVPGPWVDQSVPGPAGGAKPD
jgi:ubiquinone/menaquinone biosynthesis C-methylase UbiE